MTNPITPTPISALPPAPLVTDTPAEFDDKAYPFVQALDTLRSQMNTAATQTNQNAVASKEGADASNTSAGASAASAGASAASATTAAGHADRAEDAEQGALNAAAAAGAAIGLPVLEGKAGLSLVVKNDETGVAWSSAGFQIGGVYAGAVKPTLGVWVETDKFYFQAAYPMLAAALGTIPAVAPWTQRTPAALASIRGVAYGNGMFVAVGSNSVPANAAASSTDGVAWTARVIPGPAEAVTFGGGRFVAVGTNFAATSTDGITWTARTMPAGGWRSVAYGNGVYVAVGSGSNTATSPDGVTWTVRSGIPNGIISITYGDGRFCAVGVATAVTSVDGIIWAPGSVPASQLLSVTWGVGGFVAVGAGSGNQGVLAMTSPDGLTWTTRAIPPGVAGARYTAVTYYNGRYLAVGAASGQDSMFADSPDGVTWTSRYMPPGAFNAVLAAGGLIVAAGSTLQTALMFPYNTATEFYVPAPLGVVGLKSWMKASDAGGQGPGNQEDYLAQVVGTGANQISANGMLGRQAFLDAVGEITPMLSRPATNGLIWFESASDTAVTICKRGVDGVVRVSSPLTLS